MIAKKPKTAIYTLIAVILIASIAAGCTFTGAKENDSVASDEWFINEAWLAAEAYAAENNLNIERDTASVIRYDSGSEVEIIFAEMDGARSVSVTFSLGENGQWAVIPAVGINLLDPERWDNTSDDTENMPQNTAVVDAITDVLLGNAVFFETGLTEEIDISHLGKAFTSDDTAIMEIAGFSCIDLDKDGTLEVILSLTMNGNNAFGFEILRYHNGTVYGYSLWYREFYSLKTDGSFSYSGGAANSGFGTIRFTDETFTVEKLAYAESSYGSDNEQIVSYFIDNKSTSLVEFEAAIKKQEKKPDVSWYDFADAAEYFRHTSDMSQIEVNNDDVDWYLDYFLHDSGFVTLLESDGAFTDEAMGAYCLHKLAHYDYENGNTKEEYNNAAKKYFGRTITNFNNAMIEELPGSPEFVRATDWSFDSSAWLILRSLSEDDGVFTGQFYCTIIPDSYWTGEKGEFEAAKKALLSGDASGFGTVTVKEIEFEKKADEIGNVYLLYRSLKTVEDNVVDTVPFR